MTRRPFTNELRKQGFIKGWRDRTCWIFHKEIDARRVVHVQLWYDGHHRTTHDIDGCSDTHPTEFKTVTEMNAAIITESERKDNGWLYGPKKWDDDKPMMIMCPDGTIIIREGKHGVQTDE